MAVKRVNRLVNFLIPTSGTTQQAYICYCPVSQKGKISAPNWSNYEKLHSFLCSWCSRSRIQQVQFEYLKKAVLLTEPPYHLKGNKNCKSIGHCRSITGVKRDWRIPLSKNQSLIRWAKTPLKQEPITNQMRKEFT
jgi:hypothetical protein